MSDVSRAHERQAHLVALPARIFGVAAAPSFWVAQLLCSYAASTIYCRSDAVSAISPETISGALTAFDIAAVAAAGTGGLISVLTWHTASHEERWRTAAVALSRTRFMALLGMLSSLWFLCAIVSNGIATVSVPFCAR